MPLVCYVDGKLPKKAFYSQQVGITLNQTLKMSQVLPKVAHMSIYQGLVAYGL